MKGETFYNHNFLKEMWLFSIFKFKKIKIEVLKYQPLLFPPSNFF